MQHLDIDLCRVAIATMEWTVSYIGRFGTSNASPPSKQQKLLISAQDEILAEELLSNIRGFYDLICEPNTPPSQFRIRLCEASWVLF